MISIKICCKSLIDNTKYYIGQCNYLKNISVMVYCYVSECF